MQGRLTDSKRRLLLGAGVTSALALAAGVGWTASQERAVAPGSVNPAPTAQRAGPAGFADLVQKVSPAVVSIDITERRPVSDMRAQGLPFGFGDDGQAGAERPTQEVQGTGSGFFISSDGYILTNNHVAGDASEITVRLVDGRSLQGKLVGRDKNTDLAVVKVEGRRFPFVSFEDKARPRVGDWVVAIGNPLNLGGTVTAGIVSAYGRNIGQQFVDYMQIDAPINRGNSGGPTFDVDGRVVGVNTAIFSPSGGSIGIGFAIPATLAQSVARQLISAGHVTRGYLGATVQDVSNDITLSLGHVGLRGALVAEVTPGGPADRGRIEAGDIIIRVDGEAVAGASSLTQKMAAARVGQELRVEGLRRGQPFTATIRSGQRPSEEKLASADRASSDEEGGAGD